MNTYISMLRGINVGRHNSIKMEDLKRTFQTLGFSNVRTYVQSGNVVFEWKDEKTQEVERMIHDAIRESFGFDVVVVVRTGDAMTKIVTNTPFAAKDESKLHVTFLSAEPEEVPTEEVDRVKHRAEEFRVIGREVYLFCPNGYGNTKLSNNFFERKLRMSATTRNWRTVQALLAMAGN